MNLELVDIQQNKLLAASSNVLYTPLSSTVKLLKETSSMLDSFKESYNALLVDSKRVYGLLADANAKLKEYENAKEKEVTEMAEHFGQESKPEPEPDIKSEPEPTQISKPV